MIINVNGVNVDTNTMRTDAEIRSLISSNTSNMMTRTLLKNIVYNQYADTVQATNIGTFDFTDASMFEYAAIMIEFIGTMTLTAGTSTGYAYLELFTDSGDSITFAYLSADRNTTTTMSSVRIILEGGTPTRSTSKYTRTFTSGTLALDFDGTFSGHVGVQPSNSPTSLRLNGTINIYGIK